MKKLIDIEAYLESERPSGISDDVWHESHLYKSLMAFYDEHPETSSGYSMMECLHMHKLGKNLGGVCGFHDSLVCVISDMTKLLKQYTEMQRDYRNIIQKQLDITLEYEDKIGITEEKRNFILGGESDEKPEVSE